MKVLALNPGSSSLRFAVLRAHAGEREERLAYGSVADLGRGARATATRVGRAAEHAPAAAADHGQALEWVLAWLDSQAGLGAQDLDAVGVRVLELGVPGPAAEVESGGALERELERLCETAPLHTAAALGILRTTRAAFARGRTVAAVSDSHFHATLPPAARTYALPDGWGERHGIRRTGFHGLAIASALDERAGVRGTRPDELRSVVLHLGSGASATAVRGSRSVDTSMGFSPLEGLVMATRSGDVDPSLVAHLARAEGLEAREVVRALNERAGLLGLSGVSGDMREILRLRGAGDPRARLAFDVFVLRARQHLGARIAALGGVDELLFSGGIGERAPAVREAVCASMRWCGIELDASRNLDPQATDGCISPAGGAVSVHVVAVDEERLIARATARLASGR